MKNNTSVNSNYFLLFTVRNQHFQRIFIVAPTFYIESVRAVRSELDVAQVSK